MKVGPEAIIQINIVGWVKAKTDLCIMHIANERKCSVQYGSFLKRMGVLTGVSDLFLPKGNKKYSGLWIEVKAPGGKLTELQARFLSQMANDGYECHIVYSEQEGREVICEFYGLNKSLL